MLAAALTALGVDHLAVADPAPGRQRGQHPGHHDLWTAGAIAASWLAVWALYSMYYWTNDPTEDTLQAARFYVPAIGAISLLSAWMVTRIPGRPWMAGLTSATAVAIMFTLGTWSFHAMVASRLG